MKFISWNVNGIRAAAKKGLIESLRQMDADVYCLQETKATAEQVREVVFEMTDYALVANESKARKGYSGTAILSRKPSAGSWQDMGIEQHDREGRLVGMEWDEYFLVNTYVPNSQAELKRLDYRERWDADLAAYLKNLEREKPVIFTGDLNVAHREIDIARPKANYNKSAGFTQREIDGMDRYIGQGMVDTFRALHPEEVKYSWWSFRGGARARNVGWRIDYFLVSEALQSRVKDAFILDEVMGSDHCPVGLELK